MAAKAEINVLNVSPYPIEDQGGVAQNMRGRARYLQSEGFNVYTAGPRRRNREPSASYLHFGTALLKIAHDGTKNDVVTVTPRSAKRLMNRLDWDIVHIEEPAAALGQIAPLVLKAPKRPDGKPVAVFGATFHSRLEKPTTVTKMELITLRLLPILETWYGIPIAYRGQLHTMLMDTLQDHRIAVSEATAEFWRELFPGNYDVLYNGFDTTLFSPEGPKIEPWLDGKKTIFMAGRHDSRKGLDIGIKAFALLRQIRTDIKLMIAGKGHETRNLQNLVRQAHIPDVYFLGFLPQSELVKAFRTADVFVSPATSGEGFGRVIVEPLACGTPVVASNIPGQREAMQDQPFTQPVAVADIAAFAQATNLFLDASDEVKTQWQHDAPQYVEDNFSWRVIAPKQAEIYRKWLRSYNEINVDSPHGELYLAGGEK